MNTSTWLHRLSEQLPGWHVWYTSGGGLGRGWYAVPAPTDIEHTDALAMLDRLGPRRTPRELRKLARQRYGWYDHCETCGALARKCDHRQPEREGTRQLT